MQQRPAASPRVYTQREAAERLGVIERTIRKWVAQGLIRQYKLGTKSVRVNADDVDGMLKPMATGGGDAA